MALLDTERSIVSVYNTCVDIEVAHCGVVVLTRKSRLLEWAGWLVVLSISRRRVSARGVIGANAVITGTDPNRLGPRKHY
jgi:hypothetical protein